MNENTPETTGNKKRRTSALLTLREQEYLSLKVAGHTNKDIGEMLKVSPATVSSTLNKIKNKIEEVDPESPVLKARRGVLGLLDKSVLTFEQALNEGERSPTSTALGQKAKDRAVRVADSILKGTQVLITKQETDKREVKLSLETKRQEVILEKRLMDQFGLSTSITEGTANPNGEHSLDSNEQAFNHTHPHPGGRPPSPGSHETTPTLRSKNSEILECLGSEIGICSRCGEQAEVKQRTYDRVWWCRDCGWEWRDPRQMAVRCPECGDRVADKWYFRGVGGDSRFRCFKCGHDWPVDEVTEEAIKELDDDVRDVILRSREEGLLP